MSSGKGATDSDEILWAMHVPIFEKFSHATGMIHAGVAVVYYDLKGPLENWSVICIYIYL